MWCASTLILNSSKLFDAGVKVACSFFMLSSTLATLILNAQRKGLALLTGH